MAPFKILSLVRTLLLLLSFLDEPCLGLVHLWEAVAWEVPQDWLWLEVLQWLVFVLLGRCVNQRVRVSRVECLIDLLVNVLLGDAYWLHLSVVFVHIWGFAWLFFVRWMGVDIYWELFQTLSVESRRNRRIRGVVDPWGATRTVNFAELLGCVMDIIIPSWLDLIVFNDYVMRTPLRVQLAALFLLLRGLGLVGGGEKLIELLFLFDLFFEGHYFLYKHDILIFELLNCFFLFLHFLYELEVLSYLFFQFLNTSCLWFYRSILYFVFFFIQFFAFLQFMFTV